MREIMETIFDHNITEKEIEFITGFPNTTKEIYLSYRSDWGIYKTCIIYIAIERIRRRLIITTISSQIVLTRLFLLESLIYQFLMTNEKRDYT